MLSLKGIWLFPRLFVIYPSFIADYLLVFLCSSAKAAIQLPRAEIDLFIFFASSNLIPLEKVFESLSLPARSTTVKYPLLKIFFFINYNKKNFKNFFNFTFIIFFYSSLSSFKSIHLYSIKIYNRACDLLEFLFFFILTKYQRYQY